MNDLKTNIKFHYLYRDAGNYKEYGSIIFEKISKISLKEVNSRVRSSLIDAKYFAPLKWNIPIISTFPFDPELDHSWYEFVSVAITNEDVSDSRTIEDFIKEIIEYASL